MSRVLLQEKPDFIRYEDDTQVLIVAPSEWVTIRKDKETEEKEMIGKFKTKDEAKIEMQKLIDEKDIQEDE